jgi:hypothetical protein
VSESVTLAQYKNKCAVVGRGLPRAGEAIGECVRSRDTGVPSDAGSEGVGNPESAG